MSITKMMIHVAMYFATLVVQPAGLSLPIRQDKVQTPITEYELENVLRESYIDNFAKEPSENMLRMGWAQVALENGMGTLTYNFNLGNIGPGNKHPYYLVAGAHYRSFGSFMQSARMYWHVVSKCTTAMKYFDAGQAVPAAHALRKCGYFRADVDEYSRELNSLFYKKDRNHDGKW